MKILTAILDGVIAVINAYFALSPDSEKWQRCVSGAFALFFTAEMLLNIFR